MTEARVLVVEDDGASADAIGPTLEKLGYILAATTRPREDWVRLAREVGPEVVVVDGRSGDVAAAVEAAERLRREVDVPVVFVTVPGAAATAAFRRSPGVGSFGTLMEPFEPQELRVMVELALQHHRAERAHRLQEALLRTILASVDAGVIGVDRDRRVRFVNARAEAITGWDAAEAEGCTVGDVLDLNIPGAEDSIDEVVDAAFRHGRERWSMGAVWSRDGSLTLVDGVVAPVPAVDADAGELAVITLADRSSTARIEELVEERNRLRSTLKGSSR